MWVGTVSPRRVDRRPRVLIGVWPALLLYVLGSGCGPSATEAVPAGASSPQAAFPSTTASGRTFPSTSTRVAILTDQLPGNLTPAQQRFAATHYVGTQKLTRDLSGPLRAITPNFLVLHYRLAMWQSAPHVNYIIDGRTWGNDYRTVTMHEDWFWHNPANQRVASNRDGKLLMNVSNPGFQAYWRDSIAEQVRAGDYDGVFLDSASPALLQWEARAPLDNRLLGTGARTNTFPEFGGRSWIVAWQSWIGGLDAALRAKGIPLIPNVGALVTTWDNTDYSLTAGVFSEGFGDPGFVPSDWKDAVNQILAFVRMNKIVILQNYLASPSDLARRRYLLGNYLLVKGERTYVAYFAGRFDWYPEWNLDLGLAERSAGSVDDLRWNGVYRRDFAKGVVLVNPSTSSVPVDLGATLRRVEPQGGGAIPADGTEPGRIVTSDVSRIELSAKSAEIFLR
jgi:hypothetical protein